MYSLSRLRKLLDVDRSLIIDWCYHFKDYLPSEQKRKKDSEREFTEEEIRVFIYIYYYWEDDPDIECIQIGLNREEHREVPFTDFFKQNCLKLKAYPKTRFYVF